VTAKLARWGATAILAVLAVAAVYPLLFMIAGSVKTSDEFFSNPIGLPQDWGYLDNFVGLNSRFNVLRLLANTATYALCSLVLCLSIALPASFTLAKLRFRGSRVVFALFVGSMGIPVIAILVPNYLTFVRLGLSDSAVPVVAMWTVRALPGSIFLITALLRALPDELFDAGKVDGAGYFRTMFSIVLPLSVPGLVTASIFNLTSWWNDLLVPLVFIQTEDKQTITGSVATIGQRLAGTDYPLTIAALLVSSAAPMILYMILQGYIRQGLIMGAVK
jgi:ABC-type glycerol-3-phosphate transport system permease component